MIKTNDQYKHEDDSDIIINKCRDDFFIAKFLMEYALVLIPRNNLIYIAYENDFEMIYKRKGLILQLGIPLFSTAMKVLSCCVMWSLHKRRARTFSRSSMNCQLH